MDPQGPSNSCCCGLRQGPGGQRGAAQDGGQVDSAGAPTGKLGRPYGRGRRCWDPLPRAGALRRGPRGLPQGCAHVYGRVHRRGDPSRVRTLGDGPCALRQGQGRPHSAPSPPVSAGRRSRARLGPTPARSPPAAGRPHARPRLGRTSPRRPREAPLGGSLFGSPGPGAGRAGLCPRPGPAARPRRTHRPRRQAQRRPRPAPEARRVLDALLELHRHGCGGARRSLGGGPRRRAGSPARPPAPRSAPARPGMRPPRRRPAPPVTAGERRQSARPRAPPAVTAGERRQSARARRRPRRSRGLRGAPRLRLLPQHETFAKARISGDQAGKQRVARAAREDCGTKGSGNEWTTDRGVAAVRGAQRAVGVQNYLEEAVGRLNCAAPATFTVSSRTDAGVHALCNTAHLDVPRRPGRPPLAPEALVQALNRHLTHPAIRVLQASLVPSDFHARHAATSRTYLYRLATGCRQLAELPVFERNLCWPLRADRLDVAAMQEAAQHLLGTHDFSAFRSAGSPAGSPVRTLRRVSVSPAPASPFALPQESRRLRFWSLEFESQSFLYRQVRRMTAVLVAVGLGSLAPAQVKEILDSRDPLGKHQARVVPAHGLFLKSVQYGDLGDPGPAPGNHR
ncbi:tRNA pseudouridine synthase-like 1 isoform X2 [Oryctolagus cuniculus]|uniref:tRNA pseudouridine synthase-like 1 isoform X2 n=1 Tax=Oryctolagus cuniculus TaxID=9986 RepID=UPI00387A5CCD